jgi:hypothetical protein
VHFSLNTDLHNSQCLSCCSTGNNTLATDLALYNISAINYVKDKVVPAHAMKAHAYYRKRGIAPIILNLSTRGRYVIKLDTLATLSPVPTEEEMVWPQNSFEHFGEEKNSLP